MGSYHQALNNSSFLMTDFGYTPGYKKTNSKRKGKNHLFSNLKKIFISKNNSENNFENKPSRGFK